MERLDLQTDIENSFPELRDLKISIVDRDDRLKESDTTRRHLERDISAEVHQLIQSGAVNGEHIDHLRLRFRMWSRLLRALSVNSQSTILKVSTDPDRTREIYEQLKPLADKHGVPLRVRGTRLDESMRDEKNIEQQLHHI